MQNIRVKNDNKCPRLPWLVEFHKTAEGDVFKNQLQSAFAKTNFDHLTNLSTRSTVGPIHLTRLLCIIPPKPKEDLIMKLLEDGMMVAVIKMFKTTLEDCEETVAMLRTCEKMYSDFVGRFCPLSIAFDVTKPDLYTGKLLPPWERIHMEKGKIAKITSDPSFENRTSRKNLYVSQNIAPFVKPGDSIILGDCKVRLSALEVARDIVTCIVEKAGDLIDQMEVDLPDSEAFLQPTKEVKEYLELAKTLHIDFVFIAQYTLEKTKEILGKLPILIFTKIETAHFLDQIEETITPSDGIFINVDQLMVELDEKTFIAQKRLIALCNKLKKPVITYIDTKQLKKSQLLDISTSIMDGVDGLLLPPCNVNKVAEICKNAEASIYQRQVFNELLMVNPPPVEPIYGVCIGAVETSLQVNAKAIIIITVSGRSAQILSTLRPRCPIIAVTRFERVARKLCIFRGILPLLYKKHEEADTFQKELDNLSQHAINFGKYLGWFMMGDALIIVNTANPGSGFTNNMKIVLCSEYHTRKN